MSQMGVNEFYEALQDILQCDDRPGPDTVLANLEEWDSLAMMGVVAFFDRKLGKTINFEVLHSCATAGDLQKLADIKA